MIVPAEPTCFQFILFPSRFILAMTISKRLDKAHLNLPALKFEHQYAYCKEQNYPTDG